MDTAKDDILTVRLNTILKLMDLIRLNKLFSTLAAFNNKTLYDSHKLTSQCTIVSRNDVFSPEILSEERRTSYLWKRFRR
jgi:hypothetical protein